MRIDGVNVAARSWQYNHLHKKGLPLPALVAAVLEHCCFYNRLIGVKRIIIPVNNESSIMVFTNLKQIGLCRLLSIIIAFIVIIFSVSLGQTSRGREIEIIRTHMDSLMAVKKGYTHDQRKYSSFIPIINKLKREITAHPENKLKIARKYVTQGVDDSARILAKVVLSPNSKKPDTLSVTSEIYRIGGRVVHVFVPGSDFQIDIECWIPYDKLDSIAAIPTVATIIEKEITIYDAK